MGSVHSSQSCFAKRAIGRKYSHTRDLSTRGDCVAPGFPSCSCEMNLMDP